MSACLDCALFDCDRCAASYAMTTDPDDGSYGCCCGRVGEP